MLRTVWEGEERQRQRTGEEKTGKSQGDKFTADRLGDRQTEKEKKEPCDNITPMDMNMMMNCVAKFKSNSVVLSLMFTTQSQRGLEATLALSIISHTHSPAAVTQSCNFY